MPEEASRRREMVAHELKPAARTLRDPAKLPGVGLPREQPRPPDPPTVNCRCVYGVWRSWGGLGTLRFICCQDRKGSRRPRCNPAARRRDDRVPSISGPHGKPPKRPSNPPPSSTRDHRKASDQSAQLSCQAVAASCTTHGVDTASTDPALRPTASGLVVLIARR